ncbi:MAG: flagellar hook capping FlgD N-terminal domain-containing protein [Henriciella sp.]
MSEINPVTTTGSTTSTNTASAAAAASENTTNFNEDFDTFLQLLTAQIRNQDPLEPTDSTQFVEQLATFSSLEQQVETNTTLSDIATLIGDLSSMLANEWLGQEVAVSSKHVAYEGKPVEFEVDPAYSYDEAVLTVADSQNQIIYQKALDGDQARYTWDGDLSGQAGQADDGVYQFQVDLFEDGQQVASTPAEIISKVTALGNENGQMRIGTDSRLSANLTDVRKIEP